MKRDLDLIRAILADLEGRTKDASVFARDIKMPSRSAEEVAYHCGLLSDQGFVIGRPPCRSPALPNSRKTRIISREDYAYYVW